MTSTSLSLQLPEEPALFQLVRTGSSVDAVKLYLQYFPSSLPLPIFQDETVLQAAVTASFSAVEVWQREQDTEELELRLNILQVVAEHVDILATYGADERTIFHVAVTQPHAFSSTDHFVLISNAILDILLHQLKQNHEYLEVLFIRNTAQEMALHSAIKYGNWKAASKLLQLMHLTTDCYKRKYNFYVNVDENSTETPLLHSALQSDPSSKFIKDILRLFPDTAATQLDMDGKLPLVTALENTLPARKLDLLINAYPQALCTPTPVDQDLPLHLATLYYRTDSRVLLDVLQLLVRHYPIALTTSNSHGQWPLHSAMEVYKDPTDRNFSDRQLLPNLDLAVVQFLSNHGLIDSDEFSDLNNIHALTQSNPLNTVNSTTTSISSSNSSQSIGTSSSHREVEDLPRKNASALYHKDCYGDLPLHIACRRLATVTVETVTWLLQSYPYSAAVANDYGHLPLHLAAVAADIDFEENNFEDLSSSNEMVSCTRKLIEAYPEAVYRVDDEGDIPLQCAFTHTFVRLPLLECLLDATKLKEGNCGRIAENKNTGQLPLHTACANGIFSQEIIDALVAYDPSARLHYDLDGNLPIHVALMQQKACPVSVAHSLLYGACNATTLDDLHIPGSFLFNQSTLPCTSTRAPTLFVACEAATGTGEEALVSLDTIRFLVQRSPELFLGSS